MDVMLLSRCAILVGQMSSTLFRTAVSLRSARCDGCVMPFASLDAPWCFDWGVEAGLNVNLERNTEKSFFC